MKRKYILTLALVLLVITSFSLKVSAEDSSRGDDSDHGGQGQERVGMGKMRPRNGDGGVFGTVTAISGNSITVTTKGSEDNTNVTTYTVDATNAKIDKNRTPTTITGIAVGDNIFVEGTKNGTTVTATAIHDGVMMMKGPGMMDGDRKPGVMGAVTAISGNSITITSRGFGANTTTTTYTVDATNATVMKNGSTSSVADIAVGDTIMAQGTISGTTVTATKINDGKREINRGGPKAPPVTQGNGQPIIGGTVSAVSGSTVTITNKSNVTYTIDTSSANITKNGVASSISNITIGDTILAQGTINGTSVVAASVIDESTKGTTTTPAPNEDNGNHKGFFGKVGDFFSHLF